MRLAILATTAAALALMAHPQVVSAQEAMAAPANCAATDAALPADLAGWTARAPMAAAAKAADLGKAGLMVGKGYVAVLAPTPQVAYVTQPEKPGGSVSYGGLFALNIDQAGTYVIALGSGAWIDLLADGKPLVSTAHARGPACSTLRKMVDFQLQPGRYVLQVSANADATLPIMLARRP